MSPNEDQLRAALHADEPSAPDADGVMAMAHRQRRGRRQMLVSVAAAIVCVLAVGGLVVGLRGTSPSASTAAGLRIESNGSAASEQSGTAAGGAEPTHSAPDDGTTSSDNGVSSGGGAAPSTGGTATGATVRGSTVTGAPGTSVLATGPRKTNPYCEDTAPAAPGSSQNPSDWGKPLLPTTITQAQLCLYDPTGVQGLTLTGEKATALAQQLNALPTGCSEGGKPCAQPDCAPADPQTLFIAAVGPEGTTTVQITPQCATITAANGTVLRQLTDAQFASLCAQVTSAAANAPASLVPGGSQAGHGPPPS